MGFLSNVDAGWLAVAAIVLIGAVYIAIVGFVLGKSQADRNNLNHPQSTAA